MKKYQIGKAWQGLTRALSREEIPEESESHEEIMGAVEALQAAEAELSALRSRVEALEGERDEALEALRWIPCLSEWASGPHCAKLAEGQGKRCPTCHARAALQPDKGERLDCTGIAASWCPNCGDCTCRPTDGGFGPEEDNCPLHGIENEHAEPDKGERCETCGGAGWLDPRAEHAPCPDCKEAP